MTAGEAEKSAAEVEVDDHDGGAAVEAWSWGAGTDGQLGTGTLEDQLLPQPLHQFSDLRISRVACGGAHSIALTVDGKVLTWGRGTKGQLGHGEVVNCLKPKHVESLDRFVITNVSAGWNHSGFVTVSGHLFMCGDGSFGQLGTGDHQSHSSPTEVSYFVSEHVEQIACGMRHSLVLVRGPQESIIYGFGSAKHGQIGASESGSHKVRSFNLPTLIYGFENLKIAYIYANGDQSAALSADGQLYTWGRGFGGSSSNHSPCILPSSLRFSQVALGWNHALLIADGEAYMLGGKHHGLLSSSQPLKIEQQPSTSSAQYTLDNLSSQSPPLERIHCIGEEKVVYIAAGAEHSALVTEKGKILTWGWGEHGQLGLGNTDDQTIPHTVNITYKGRTSDHIRVYCGSGFTLMVNQCREI
ncbi:ultraviolet-B receptor UVR8 isoform X2 [Asparagus officinalis]|uniref:ultraviolet-B receptor UVR8 isoform X2 n=1 Tax=Asparagus officinalis TaxID=4686 RepID=UPI00098E7428|nr:ultraviolet-B receptor UVR8 isoform X2 [Asparagus officinalis]